MPERVKVRMLVSIGGYQAGQEVVLTDRPLEPDYITEGGPTTLIESYVAAGYVEIVL